MVLENTYLIYHLIFNCLDQLTESIMIRKLRFLLLLFLMGFSADLMAQMNKEMRSILPQDWNQKDILVSLEKEEKLALLKRLTPIDSILFEDYTSEELGYFPLDTAALKFLDLNSDGHLDLLYSSTSGPMGMQDTKVFFQQEGKLQLVKQLKGGVFHLTKNKTNTELSTLWQPCCGSYTSRLLTYRFSESESGELQSAIFFIGRLTPILVDEI